MLVFWPYCIWTQKCIKYVTTYIQEQETQLGHVRWTKHNRFKPGLGRYIREFYYVTIYRNIKPTNTMIFHKSWQKQTFT